MNLPWRNDLDVSRIGAWPKLAQRMLILCCCALAGGGLYYALIAGTLTLLSQERAREVELRAQFESKAMLAANLGAYQLQLKQLARRVETQLKQLPNRHEVAGLLDDISLIATDNGLQLNRINWEPEIRQGFSTELPMRIEVVGNYHQLGQFTADMAALPRIVILEAFTLTRRPDQEEAITMTMQAKTYKYRGERGEVAP